MGTNEDFKLDGIPVFVHPQGRGESPLARVSITFRVGTYDEMLAYAGITRLAHQVICASLPLELREYITARNGGIFTMFNIAAPVERFNECLRELAKAVRNPDWTATERIQRLLAADPNPDATYPADVMLRDRYGSVGPGTAILQPMALSAVSHDALETWVREHFCRENAAIVSTESAIETGTFIINSGQSRGILLNTPQPLELPAYFNNGDDGISFQLLLPAGSVSDLSVAILAELLHKRITQLEQLSPRVAFGSNLLDSQYRSFTGSMPIAEDNVLAAVAAIRQTLNDVADGFIGTDIVDRVKANIEEALREQIRSGEDVFTRAQAAIFSSSLPADGALGALANIDASAVSATVRESLSSLILYVPEGVELSDIAAGRSHDPDPIEGKKYRKIGLPLFRGNRSTVIAGEAGITFKSPGSSVTILFAECTALLDSGIALQLIDRNGSFIKLFPSMYRKGGDLAKSIRDHVDPTLTVPVAASEDDSTIEKQSLQQARDFSGWRAVVGVIAAAYLLALLLWIAYRVTQFAGENVAQFALVSSVMTGLAWFFRPTRRRTRMAKALRAFAEVFRHLSPGLILTYLIDTLLIIQSWELLTRNPPNYWGVFLLVIALVPFAFAFFTFKRSRSTGRQRYFETFRSIWLGNVAQIGIGFVVVFIASTITV
jgi:hypothetical protein